LEYVCEIWDGCNISDSDKLEKLQLAAARIVTGLPAYSKHSLYYETEWSPLSERRKNKNLIIVLQNAQ